MSCNLAKSLQRRMTVMNCYVPLFTMRLSTNLVAESVIIQKPSLEVQTLYKADRLKKQVNNKVLVQYTALPTFSAIEWRHYVKASISMVTTTLLKSISMTFPDQINAFP